MKLLGKTITLITLILSGSLAMAGEVSVNDCGSSLAQVKQIIQSKLSGVNPEVANRLIGRWIYGTYDPIEIRMNGPLKIMGYEILVCPRGDGAMLVLWKEEKTKAGVLRQKGQNLLVISETKYGALKLERESSMTAQNR